MNLALLILAAIAIPFTILTIFLLFSRSMMWLAPRPRTRASIFGILGIVYPSIAVWEAQAEGWRLSSYLGIIPGIWWIAFAITDYGRGSVISCE